jgi:hypothetical protein
MTGGPGLPSPAAGGSIDRRRDDRLPARPSADPSGWSMTVSGVGYDVAVPLSTFYQLGEEDAGGAAHSYACPRDQLALFRFLTEGGAGSVRAPARDLGIGPRSWRSGCCRALSLRSLWRRLSGATWRG